jgi:hypothetical protein
MRTLWFARHTPPQTISAVTIESSQGGMHFLMKTLPKVALARVTNIMDVKPIIAAIRA